MFTKSNGTGILIAKLRAIADALERKDALLVEVDIHERGNPSEAPETAVRFKVVSVENRVKAAREDIPQWKQLVDMHFNPGEDGLSYISDVIRAELWGKVNIVGNRHQVRFLANKANNTISQVRLFESYISGMPVEDEFVLIKYLEIANHTGSWYMFGRRNMDIAICTTLKGAQEFIQAGKK